jgi:hypothetical protein
MAELDRLRLLLRTLSEEVGRTPLANDDHLLLVFITAIVLFGS